MDIFDITVTTPMDNPLRWDHNWRQVVARVWADHPDWVPDYSELYDDAYLVEHRDYLIRCQRLGESVANREFRPHKWVLDWNNPPQGLEVSEKDHIESLLLTGATMDVIAKDMGGGRVPPDVFTLYEKLFFNVRNDEGLLDESCYRRSAAVLEELNGDSPRPLLWRTTAHRVGYPGVTLLWAWSRAHGLTNPSGLQVSQEAFREGQAIMLEQVMRRTINNFDLVNFFSAATAHERMQRETGGGASAETKAVVDMLAGVLRAAKPEMMEAAKTVDEQAAEDKAIRERFQAQAKVSKTPLPTNAPERGEAALDAVIDKSFKQGE
jgi:hypothetical protein